MIPDLAVSLLLAGGARTPALAPSSVKWERNFEEASRKARKAAKPVIVDFWADWCGWCERLDRTTYADPFVARKAQDFVAVKVNTEGSRRDVDVATKYEVNTLPTILFLSPEGRQLMRVNGYQGPGQFPRTLDDALAIARRVIALEETLARSPDDAGALAALGAHQFDTGQRYYSQQCLDEARELLKRAVAHDAEEPLEERRHTRLLLAILHNIDRNFAEAERLVKDALSLGPRGEEEPKLLFLLGRTYVSWGRQDEGAATMEIIVRQYPQSPLAQKARDTLTSLRPH
ncbi:MAG: thioredoxin family protein [Betaproteobacteria bacterium]